MPSAHFARNVVNSLARRFVGRTMSGMVESGDRKGNVIIRFVQRVLVLLGAAVVIGVILHFVARSAHRLTGPADFKAGVLHGALMPLALPNLLVGDDITIYATENVGRAYKLGYTIGVNACGVLFFGFFFWRVRRWRRKGEIKPAPESKLTPAEPGKVVSDQ
jgi:hypothetical protein